MSIATQPTGNMQLTITIPDDFQLRPKAEQMEVALSEIMKKFQSETTKSSVESANSKREIAFLKAPVWEGDQDSPADISENVDHYLYDVEALHGA